MAKLGEDIATTILQKMEDIHGDMNEKISSLRDNVTGIMRDISSINVTTTKQQATLEEHIRRTEINEEGLALLREKREEDIATFNNQLEPLKNHVAMWSGAFKLVTVFGAVLGIGYTVYKMVVIPLVP